VSGGPWQVDVDRNDRQIELRRQEVQRHHDPVVELPLLGIGDVDLLHHAAHQAQRQVGVAGYAGLRDAEPAGILDRPLVVVGHADRVGRHVVHEEVREVLGGDDDQRVGFAAASESPHGAEGGMEGVAQAGSARWARPVMPGRGCRRREDQAHGRVLTRPPRRRQPGRPGAR
jgi:hypothetical protein